MKLKKIIIAFQNHLFDKFSSKKKKKNGKSYNCIILGVTIICKTKIIRKIFTKKVL